MLAGLTVLAALDFVSAALTLGVVAFFLVSWRRSGSTLHLIAAAAFLLLAVSFATVTTSAFDTQRTGSGWDAVRIAGQTGGALTLAFTYLSARRHGEPRPWRVLGATVSVAAVLFGFLFWMVEPIAHLPSLRVTLVVAHATQILAFATCAVLAGRGFVARPTRDRALVPLAFVAWTLSKYTWLLIDVTDAWGIVPVVLVWRFSAIALLLAALRPPRVHASTGPGEVTDAAA